MAREQMTFESWVVEKGREKLLDKLRDLDRDMYNCQETIRPETYVKFKEDKMQKIREHIDVIANEGKRNNVEVYLNSKYPDRVYFSYIFYVPFSI